VNPAIGRQKAPGLRSERFILLTLCVAFVLGAAYSYVAARRPLRASAASPRSPEQGVPADSVALAATSRAPSAPASVSGVERGVVPALEPRVSEAARSAQTPEQGHGAEIWRRSDDAELDFEPRFALDAGPVELGSTPRGAFH
jgi:hypothetical protein